MGDNGWDKFTEGYTRKSCLSIVIAMILIPFIVWVVSERKVGVAIFLIVIAGMLIAASIIEHFNRKQ